MENPFEIIIERLDKIEKILFEISKNNVSESQVSNSDEIMTVDQLAEYLSIARQTIYGKCSAREIPCFKTGKRVYFMKSEINEWLKAGKRETAFEIRQQAADWVRKHPLKK
ncbi:MAG: helix-turn-helix domain-containing protein [Paludibacter sp.]